MRKQKFDWSRLTAWLSAVCGIVAIAAAVFTHNLNQQTRAEIAARRQPVAQTAPAAAPVDTTPLTAVAVTQCNDLVVLYVTTNEGKLVKFDKSTGIPLEQVLEIGQSAKTVERVEVNCDKGATNTSFVRTEGGATAACQQKLCPGPKRPLFAGDGGNDRKPPVRTGDGGNDRKPPVLA